MRIITLITGLILCFTVIAHPQIQVQQQAQTSKTDLEKRRAAIMDAIKQTENELEATKKNKNATMGQLRALQSKLSERQHLISVMNEEVSHINNNIQNSNNTLGSLRQNLDGLKIRYAQSLRYAYSSRSSYDMLAFLFSSQNFNDALRRLKYLKKYRDYRIQQVEQIKVTQGQIQKQLGILNTEKSQKDVLLQQQQEQKLVLQKETNETDQVVNELKGKEHELMSQIEKNKKATRQLDKAISDVIHREIELARKKAEDEMRKQQEAIARNNPSVNRTNPPNNNPTNYTRPSNNTNTNNSSNNSSPNNKPATNANNNKESYNDNIADRPSAKYNSHRESSNYEPGFTPEASALSSNFEANRGRLPWPVEKGFISDRFGKHPHPVEQKVMIVNNGIDIRTSSGATARAVFEGTVNKIFKVPGSDWNVIISHGRYLTVYAHLANVSVREGQSVSTKQSLGTIGKNDDGDNVISFQIWKINTKSSSTLDPEPWIAR